MNDPNEYKETINNCIQDKCISKIISKLIKKREEREKEKKEFIEPSVDINKNIIIKETINIEEEINNIYIFILVFCEASCSSGSLR